MGAEEREAGAGGLLQSWRSGSLLTFLPTVASHLVLYQSMMHRQGNDCSLLTVTGEYSLIREVTNSLKSQLFALCSLNIAG